MRNQNRQAGADPGSASRGWFPSRGMAAVVMAGLVVASPGLAQPAPPDAAALQSGLRAWFEGLLAPAFMLSEPPLTVVADGEGFVLSLPVTEKGKADQAITATLRPLSGGRWSLDNLRVPAAGVITLDPTAGSASDMTYSIADQSARAVIDLSLASRSSATMELRDVALAMRVDGQNQAQRFERYVIQGTLIPGADGRVHLVQNATITGWESSFEIGPSSAAETEIRRGRIGMRLDGLRTERLAAAFTSIKALIAEVRAGNGPDADAKALPPGMRAQARMLIESFRDIATRIEGEETLDDFSMKIPGVGEIELEQLHFAMGGEAPDGRLRAWAEIVLDGLDIADLPQGIRDYIPSRIALRPVLSGISTEQVFALLLHAVEEKPDEDRLTKDATAMLTTGGASIGLESMTLEIDKLRIEGNGRLRMLTPTKAGIEARLTATGLDATMADAGKKADLRMIMPVLAMIRGLGRPEGDKIVWDLAITDDQALVNGIDMMAAPAPAEPPQRKPNKR